MAESPSSTALAARQARSVESQKIVPVDDARECTEERCCHTLTGSGGELYYNSLTSPFTVTYSALSNGSTNLVELVPPTILSGAGTSSDWRIDAYNTGRLRYSGATARRMLVTATVSMTTLANAGDQVMYAIYRNANTVLNDSRVSTYAPGSETCQALVIVQPGDFFSVVTGVVFFATPPPNTATFSGLTITAIAL